MDALDIILYLASAYLFPFQNEKNISILVRIIKSFQISFF